MKGLKSKLCIAIIFFVFISNAFSIVIIPAEIYSDDNLLRYWGSYSAFEYEIFEYDENGNVIYYEEREGKYEISEYDENGLLVSRTDKTGFSTTATKYDFYYEYNSEGKLFCVKQVRTSETREGEYISYTYYDLNGNEIFRIYPNGEVTFKHYDENGNLIKDDEGTYKYNEKNQMIYSCNTYNTESFYFYDENGNLIEQQIIPQSSSTWVRKIEYNSSNQVVYEKQFSFEAWYTYNSKGLLEKCTINKFRSNGEDEGDEIYEYDKNGNVIYFKNWDVELTFEYEFYPNGKVKRRITRKVN